MSAQNALADAEEEDEEAPEELEEVVELLLCSLSDKDTVVRWVAAKGIGRATWRRCFQGYRAYRL